MVAVFVCVKVASDKGKVPEDIGRVFGFFGIGIISKEVYHALKDWMKYHDDAGELIDENSWLMLCLWDTRVVQGRGFATKPIKLVPSRIKRLIERVIWVQLSRKKLQNGRKDTPFLPYTA